jgi:hypothetical protein
VVSGPLARTLGKPPPTSRTSAGTQVPAMTRIVSRQGVDGPECSEPVGLGQALDRASCGTPEFRASPAPTGHRSSAPALRPRDTGARRRPCAPRHTGARHHGPHLSYQSHAPQRSRPLPQRVRFSALFAEKRTGFPGAALRSHTSPSEPARPRPIGPAAPLAPRLPAAPTRTVYWSVCSDNPCLDSGGGCNIAGWWVQQ